MGKSTRQQPSRDPNQKLVLLKRQPPAAVPVVPDKRDMASWLESVSPTTPGRYAPPPRPLAPGETLTVQTQEQFDLLSSAVEAVEANKPFDRAENTQAAYANEWRVFVQWCAARGQKPMPASPACVKAYIADMAACARPRVLRGALKPGTPEPPPRPPRRPGGLQVALAAIGWYHGHYGYLSPHRDPLVKDELNRIRRRVGAAPTRKSPLTIAHLDQIVAMLEVDRRCPVGRTALERKAAVRRTIRDKAIILFGFAGAFRRAELAAVGLEDVAFQAEGIDATLRHSKTDQTGLGFVKAILAGEDPRLCPKRALEDWCAAMGVTAGPVFREIDNQNRLVLNATAGTRVSSGLTGDAIALVVKQYVARIGLNPVLYSGHSMRAGFITAAAEAGRSVHEIMALSGHKTSEVVAVYVRSAKRWDNSPGRGLL